MLRNILDIDSPTFDLFIPAVISRTSCRRHNADTNEPCFTIITIQGALTRPGICNTRAKKSGMNSPIRPTSLRVGGTNKF